MGAFGLTPDMIPLLQQQEDTQAGVQAGQLGPTGAIISAGNVAGNMIGRGIAGAMGYQDPRIQQAQRLQAAMHETESAGIDYGTNPVGYMSLAARNLFKYGLYEQGMHVSDQIKELAQGQSAMATANATNQSTSQKQQAIARIQQINTAFTKEDGTYDQKGAIAAQMRDPNPEVRAAGINSAKEYQALLIGKLVPKPPGTELIDAETRLPVGGASNPSVSWPGESSDETNRRVLIYYSNLDRPLTVPERKDAEQRYKDYSNPAIQGVGISTRPVTDALNPANFGKGQPQSSGGATNPVTGYGGGPTASAAPATFGAGRTAPIKVDLPGGGGRVEAGMFQGAEGQKRLDDQTKQMSEYVTKNYIPQLDRAFANVKAVLDAYPEDKTPGLGGAWNSPMAGYVMGIGQQIGSPELKKEMKEAKDNRTSIVAVSNYITRLMAGLNQTQGETARVMMEQALGTDSTEADFRNAFTKLFQMYRDTRAGVLGGYPIEVRQKFSKQSGLNMTDVSALPPPSMKTLPQKADVRARPDAILPSEIRPSVAAPPATTSPQQAPPLRNDAPPGVDPQLWRFMTPQERALWQN